MDCKFTNVKTFSVPKFHFNPGTNRVYYSVSVLVLFNVFRIRPFFIVELLLQYVDELT